MPFGGEPGCHGRGGTRLDVQLGEESLEMLAHCLRAGVKNHAYLHVSLALQDPPVPAAQASLRTPANW